MTLSVHKKGKQKRNICTFYWLIYSKIEYDAEKYECIRKKIINIIIDSRRINEYMSPKRKSFQWRIKNRQMAFIVMSHHKIALWLFLILEWNHLFSVFKTKRKNENIVKQLWISIKYIFDLDANTYSKMNEIASLMYRNNNTTIWYIDTR